MQADRWITMSLAPRLLRELTETLRVASVSVKEEGGRADQLRTLHKVDESVELLSRVRRKTRSTAVHNLETGRARKMKHKKYRHVSYRIN